MKFLRILVATIGLLLGALIVFAICFLFPSDDGEVETIEFSISPGE